MYYHIDMITHNTAYDEPIGGTGGRKLVTCRYQVNCQSNQNGDGMNHQTNDYLHIRANIKPLPCPCLGVTGCYLISLK